MSAGLVLLLLLEAGVLANRWQVLTLLAEPLPESASALPAGSPRSLSAVAAGIAEAHLFGDAAGAPADATPLSASRVNYVLRGTIATGGPVPALAILAIDEARQTVFRAGDALPDGARLHRIDTLGVVIDRAGALEWLALPRAQSNAAVRVAGRPRAAMRTDAVRPGAAVGAETLAGLELDVARGSAGEVIGLLPGGGRWANVGLKGGDVITAIDGVPVARLVADQFTLTRLAMQKSARLTVQRGNDTVTLKRVAMR